MKSRPYGESWTQADFEALEDLFVRARREGLWFFHGGLSGPLWFTPDELEEKQRSGQFLWGAVNWRLRDPQERLDEARRRLQEAQKECDNIAMKIAGRRG